MEILVYNPAASEGGALTILKSYYEKAINDKNNKWKFIVSTTELLETDNIEIYQYPWVKKSWFHRLYFENFIWPRLYNKIKGDKIISLQNILAPHVDQPQDLYFHQALVFSDYKFSFRENKLFWIYQNIISKFIFKSLLNSNHIIVQTNWIKNDIINNLGIDERKISVEYPEVLIKKTSKKRATDSNKRFFYPAGAYKYKNHDVICKASKIIKDKGFNNFEIVFTITGDENEYSKKIKEYNDKNIKFVGKLNQEAVTNLYLRSTLIFTSYIESNPLPLTEAKILGSFIIASDEKFSREVLSNYYNYELYSTFSEEELAEKMLKEIQKQ